MNVEELFPKDMKELLKELHRLEMRVQKEPCMLEGQTTETNCFCSRCVCARAGVVILDLTKRAVLFEVTLHGIRRMAEAKASLEDIIGACEEVLPDAE